jgi:hypothetical protein
VAIDGSQARSRRDTLTAMGPVWKLVKGVKDECSECGKEIVDFPAVGTVVDFEFHPEEKFCWECYEYRKPFVDEIGPSEKQDPFQPVSKPLLP